MQRWMRNVRAMVGGIGVAGGLSGAGALALLGSTATAIAQSDIKAVDPYVVVVTTDNTPMRCSNGVQLFYAVREVKAGETLRVNGEGPGWLRVEYTPGMKAYVPASEVEAARDAQTVKLTRPSRLLAVSADGKRPWWPLDLDADIPAGTVLKVSKPFQSPDNVIEGYYVDAPARARGYVKPEQVRRATPEEAARHMGTVTPPAPAQPAPAATQPAAPAAAQPADQPASGGVAPAPTANNPAPEGTPPGFNPVTPVSPTPAPVEPSAAVEPVVVPPPPPPPPPKKDEELELIRTTFNNVMTSASESELPSVITMFENKIAKLGSSAADQQIRGALEQRLEALRLKQEIIRQRDEVKMMTAGRSAEMTRISLMVAEAQRQAIYNIVGRIQASTVYDGKRGMPLMYRVESADAISPRTVGYIIPAEGMDLLTKVGKVCGVVGENRFDPALQLNIVAPRRIDVLDVGGSTISPTELQPFSPSRIPQAPSGDRPPAPGTTVVPIREPEK